MVNRGKVFFTSDPHFGHGNILKYCRRTKFMTPEEIRKLDAGEDFRVSRESIDKMSTHLIDQINTTVGEDDTLWCLGDWSFPSNYEEAMKYRFRIHCKDVNLVLGNHDKRGIAKAFSICGDLIELSVDHLKIVLCHYAMAIFNGSHRSALHLYGHSHSGAEETMDKAFPDRRSMDAGVDNAFKLLGEYRPFSIDEIKKRLLPKKGAVIDHHGAKKKR